MERLIGTYSLGGNWVDLVFILLILYLALKLMWDRSEKGTRLTTCIKTLWIYARGVLYMTLVVLILIYAVYFVFTLHYPPEKQLTDTTTILASFSPQWIAKINISLVENPVLRPLGEYGLGLLMVLQRSAGGNTSYFLGEISNTGWWYYFPVVFLLKEPLPSLLLLFFAIGFGLIRFWKTLKTRKNVIKEFSNLLGTHFSECAMFLFILIYWVYSMRSPLNIGVRHLIPTLPFIYTLTTLGIKSWTHTHYAFVKGFFASLSNAIRHFMKISLKFIFIAIMLAWFLGETIGAAPYFLSYFNQIGGGVKGGYRYVTDSNYDWGQDLKQLQNFVEENNIEKIAVDYFGGGDLEYYLGSSVVEYWWSARGNPKESGIEWFAISINNLQGAFGDIIPSLERKPEDAYPWLATLKNYKEEIGEVPTPDYRAGTSIFIYRL